MASYKGTAGNDTLTGTSSSDDFNLVQGGEDSASGLAGNDIFRLGATLDAGDSVDGGSGNDELLLRGDYSAGVTFGSGTVADIARIVLAAGFDYKLTSNDATVAAGQTMKVVGSALGGANTLTFDGSAETDGHFVLIGGAGNDVLSGGQNGDTFTLSSGGEDTVTGGAGDDTIDMGHALDAGDTINGGGGRDVLRLHGDYSAGVTLSATTISGIEDIQFVAGHNYNLTVNAANFTAGSTVLVNANELLAASNALTFNASASDANFHFIGGAGNDVLTAGSGTNLFDLSLGGNDKATGGSGGDAFVMGGALTAADTINGGAGGDTVELNGDYSAGVVFGATTITNVEKLSLAAGHSYDLTTNDANIAAGKVLTVDGSALGAGDQLTFNGSAETNGKFIITGGAGNDVLTGGQDGDTFNLLAGGNDTAHGGRGDDVFNVGATLTAADSIDGGAGNDTVTLNGDYSAGVVFGAATLANVETLSLAAGHSYNLTTDDANVASGAALTVDGSALGASDSLVFDGSAETDGTLAIKGGAGDDTITLGAQLATKHDTVDGGGGNDTLVLDANPASANPGGADLIGGAFQNLETIKLAAGQTYEFAISGDITSGGGALNVDASALAASNSATVDFSQATTPTLNFTGGAGDDTVVFSSNAHNWGTVNGGGGNNVFEFKDSQGAIVSGASVTNFSTLRFADGYDYTGIFVTGDITGGNGALTVDASALTGTHSVSVDLSGVTSSGIDFTGGAGDDTITLGAVHATIDLTSGGNDTVHGSGLDLIDMGSTLTADNSIDGGISKKSYAQSTVTLDGDYSAGLILGASTLVNILKLSLTAGHSYNITTNDATLAAGAGMEITGGALGATDTLTLDISAETDSSYDVFGGAGDDTIITSASEMRNRQGTPNVIDGGGGFNTIEISTGGTIPIHATNYFHIQQLVLSGAEQIALSGDITTGTGTLTIDASATTSDTMTADGTETTLNYIGGGGVNSILTAVSRYDSTNIGHAGTIDGAAGSDTLKLSGSTSAAVTLSDAYITHVEHVVFQGQVANWVYLVGDISGSGAVSISTSSTQSSIDMSQATTAEIDFTGGSVNDSIVFGANFNASDRIDGGGSYDTLALNGDYSAGLTLGASTLTGVEAISLTGGHSYNLTTNDGNVASGATLTVDASALGAGNALTFNGSAESDGSFDIVGGAGNDNLTGGGQADTFDLTHGGTDTAHGGGGDDNFYVDGASAAADTIDGGAGNDTLTLTAGGTLNASAISSVENFDFSGDASSGYDVAIVGDLSGGGTVTLDFGQVQNGGVTIDLMGATTANFDIVGSGGDDTVILGPGENLTGYIQGGGFDTLELSGGSAGLTLDAATTQGFCFLTFADGASYSGITLVGDIANNTSSFTVDASALTGSNSVDVDLSQETTIAIYVTGGAGDDTFTFSQSSLGVVQSFDGGGGGNTLGLNGLGSDINANLQDSVFQNVQNIALTDGNNYSVDVTGDITSGHGTLSIDASALSSAYGANINLNSATTSTIDVTGGAGDDVVSVWAQNVTVDFSHGGNDTFYAGPGNALIEMGGTLDAGDQIYGLGAPGTVTVSLDGDYSAGLDLSMINSVNEIDVGAGHSYNLTLEGYNPASSTFVLDGSALGVGDSLIADGSAISSGVDMIGGAGDDVLTGGDGNDTFDLTAGGNDSAHGGGGDDHFTIGSDTGGGTTIDGGAGNDVLTFLDASNIDLTDNVTGVETLVFTAGSSYNIYLGDAFLPAGATGTVDASALGAGDSITLDVSGEGDGNYHFIGGAGDDTIYGSIGNDTIDLSRGGNDSAFGGYGDDTFTLGGALTAGDTIDGGGGNDVLNLDGDYSAGLVLGPTTIANIVTLTVADGHSYNLTSDDANVNGDNTLTVDGSALSAGYSLVWNGAAETDGHFEIIAGAGADVLTGGQQSDLFVFNSTADSTSTVYDTITNLNFSSDHLQLGAVAGDYTPTAIDAAIATGALSTATFDSDLAADVSSSNLAANHAVLFTADLGTLSGHTFLVIDHNGVAGYQSGSDYVIDVTGYTGTLATSSFI